MNASPALVVAYDISDNRKRRLLFKHLSAYGTPLQESVFYCPVTGAAQRQQLSRELKEVPLAENERVHCFLVHAGQTALLSPSPIDPLCWIAE